MEDFSSKTNVQRFMDSVLEYGIKKIFDKQLEIAAQRRMSASQRQRSQARARGEASRIETELRKRVTQISTTATGGAELWAQVPLVMRFCDMKRNGDWKIYNQPIWGILYHEVFSDLSNKYRSWITFQMRLSLGRAFDPKMAARVADQSYINISTTI
ncbi:MAG: hypothetical protein KBT20_00765 [Bacteroidales bacterium]|nr:hypothetical protein [Candidatus Liminaster caballi]